MKKKAVIITSIVVLVLVGIGAFLVMKRESKPVTTASNKQSDSKSSLSNGYFYQYLGNQSYDASFNYPIAWGDVNYKKIDFSKVTSENAAPYTGYVAYGTFSNNPNAYIVLRTNDLSVTPDTAISNPNILQEAGITSEEYSRIYNQVGGTVCIGDGQFYQEDIELNNAKSVFCPKGGEKNPNLDTLIFESKDITPFKFGRILPSFTNDEGKQEHVAVIDLPYSDFSNNDSRFGAIALVYIDSNKQHSQEFLDLVNSAKLY